MSLKKKTLLVTGANGFIGRALCENLSKQYTVIGLDNCSNNLDAGYHLLVADMGDVSLLKKVCETYKPSIVVHCAGISSQVFARTRRETFFKVNSKATEKLAELLLATNPDIHFIFLSSVSVYGEDNVTGSVSEECQCKPSNEYAISKFDAENRLIKLHNTGRLKKIDILRLAPVYDSERSLNIDKRVFTPKKLTYLNFGSGDQEMSAVSRENVIDFIEYRLKQEEDIPNDEPYCKIFNVCDDRPYKFKEIITVLKQSGYHSNQPVLKIPLSLIWIVTRLAGLIFINKRQWIHSCYNKLAFSLIFDIKKMLDTGFKPKQNLGTVFLNKKNRFSKKLKL